MNLQQAKITLEKINRLYQSMILDASNIDVFEQDLMLSYIKQLYDSFSPDDIQNFQKSVNRRTTPILPPTSKPIEIIKEPAKVVHEETPTPPTPKKEETTIPATVWEEVPVPAEVVRPVVEAPKEVPPKTPTPVQKAKINPDHALLFEQQEAKELSEKLSSQPIRDLNKAMGINERFLTINELFSKDDKAYQEAIKQLNALSSFEEAKDILSNLAEKHDWTEKGKKKKAQVFIKLVRRRYL